MCRPEERRGGGGRRGRRASRPRVGRRPTLPAAGHHPPSPVAARATRDRGGEYQTPPASASPAAAVVYKGRAGMKQEYHHDGVRRGRHRAPAHTVGGGGGGRGGGAVGPACPVAAARRWRALPPTRERAAPAVACPTQCGEFSQSSHPPPSPPPFFQQHRRPRRAASAVFFWRAWPAAPASGPGRDQKNETMNAAGQGPAGGVSPAQLQRVPLAHEKCSDLHATKETTDVKKLATPFFQRTDGQS